MAINKNSFMKSIKAGIGKATDVAGSIMAAPSIAATNIKSANNRRKMLDSYATQKANQNRVAGQPMEDTIDDFTKTRKEMDKKLKNKGL